MARGFQIIRRYKGDNFSLKLFVHNSNRFSVVLRVYVWKFSVYRKTYSYQDLELAERIFERILERRESQSAPYLQSA